LLSMRHTHAPRHTAPATPPPVAVASPAPSTVISGARRPRPSSPSPSHRCRPPPDTAPPRDPPPPAPTAAAKHPPHGVAHHSFLRRYRPKYPKQDKSRNRPQPYQWVTISRSDPATHPRLIFIPETKSPPPDPPAAANSPGTTNQTATPITRPAHPFRNESA
jgi:hypothetical protein